MKVLITGGAGYIGSVLTAVLLERGHEVVVVDTLQFGGDSLLAFWHHPAFRFIKADITDSTQFNEQTCAGADVVVHLAGVVGFPACQSIGREESWRINVEGTERVFDSADRAGVGRFIFASTYSNYGLSVDGEPVTEESPLHPQSVYAETKIASEQFLLAESGRCRIVPIIFRFATLFGIGPRTRFDLIINQFVREALTKGELVIYERGYSRSFVHVRDVAEGICIGLDAEESKLRGHVYNLGSEAANYTKEEIIALIRKHIPTVEIKYRDMSFGGDMRDVRVSFAKIRRAFGFEPRISVEQGIVEVRDVVSQGVIKDALSSRFLNANLITQ